MGQINPNIIITNKIIQLNNYLYFNILKISTNHGHVYNMYQGPRVKSVILVRTFDRWRGNTIEDIYILSKNYF